VHVIDVVRRVHVGYVAAPGTIAGPRGVAARGSQVAVSAWKRWGRGDHVVRLFEGSEATWTAARVIAGGFGAPGRADGQLNRPYGLRLSRDGTSLAVADLGNGRVSLFRVDTVEEGSFVSHVATHLPAPMDVEECEDGRLIADNGTKNILLAECPGGDGGPPGRLVVGPDTGQLPTALTHAPGLGLLVTACTNLCVFVAKDTLAMAAMSPVRVAWMAVVGRVLQGW
jgi:hypothetical protein